MAALRAAVLDLDGAITVHSARGVGTHIVMTFPALDQREARGEMAQHGGLLDDRHPS